MRRRRCCRFMKKYSRELRAEGYQKIVEERNICISHGNTWLSTDVLLGFAYSVCFREKQCYNMLIFSVLPNLLGRTMRGVLSLKINFLEGKEHR